MKKKILFSMSIVYVFWIPGVYSDSYFSCQDNNGQNIYTDNQNECSNPVELDIKVTAGTESEPVNIPDEDTPIENTSYHLISTYGSINAVDGTMDKNEWKNVDPYISEYLTPLDSRQNIYIYVMHDIDALYIAVKYEKPVYINRQSLFMEFNEELKDFSYEGQDSIGLTTNQDGSLNYYDEVRTQNPPCKQNHSYRTREWCAFQDKDVNGTVDGLGKLRMHGNTAIYEFMRPLKSKDIKHDFQLNHGDIFGISMSLGLSANDPTALKSKYFREIYIPGPKPSDLIKIKIPSLKEADKYSNY